MKINNRNMPAQPLVSDKGLATHSSHIKSGQCTGLSKYEESLLRIMAGICANPNYMPMSEQHFDAAADDAVKQARVLMKKMGW